jgi:DNA methylase
MPGYVIKPHLEWHSWVTPKPLRQVPVHRWYYFPHSFTNRLVHNLIDEWNLTSSDRILDSFCGAGTTVLAAKEKGIPAVGYDLSPLAVLATRVKISHYRAGRLWSGWKALQRLATEGSVNSPDFTYPVLIKRALPGKLLPVFHHIFTSIEALNMSQIERDFFRLAVLSILPQFSRAVPTGGWLSWGGNRANSRGILRALSSRVEEMYNDVRHSVLPTTDDWHVRLADARNLPVADEAYSAVITSPPYPNRHDYTRVFGVELMFAFLDWSQTRALRYQSFHSHPESKPSRPDYSSYTEPALLRRILKYLQGAENDKRIPRMLKGYFIDLFLTVKEAARVCRSGAHLALVLGNAQYRGRPILVDCLAAQIGEQVGLKCERVVAVRQRGNSAQQMGVYGRNPSRESVVMFHKP